MIMMVCKNCEEVESLSNEEQEWSHDHFVNRGSTLWEFGLHVMHMHLFHLDD